MQSNNSSSNLIDALQSTKIKEVNPVTVFDQIVDQITATYVYIGQNPDETKINAASRLVYEHLSLNHGLLGYAEIRFVFNEGRQGKFGAYEWINAKLINEWFDTHRKSEARFEAKRKAEEAQEAAQISKKTFSPNERYQMNLNALKTFLSSQKNETYKNGNYNKAISDINEVRKASFFDFCIEIGAIEQDEEFKALKLAAYTSKRQYLADKASTALTREESRYNRALKAIFDLDITNLKQLKEKLPSTDARIAFDDIVRAAKCELFDFCVPEITEFLENL